jgi:hypothetical protein
MQRLIDARLIEAKHPAPLQHQHDLARFGFGQGSNVRRIVVLDVIHVTFPWKSAARHDVRARSDFVTFTLQCTVQPPSTGNAIPAIDAAASLARKTVSAPSSSIGKILVRLLRQQHVTDELAGNPVHLSLGMEESYSLTALTGISRQGENEAPDGLGSQHHNGNGCHPCDQPGVNPVLYERKGAEKMNACDAGRNRRRET